MGFLSKYLRALFFVVFVDMFFYCFNQLTSSSASTSLSLSLNNNAYFLMSSSDYLYPILLLCSLPIFCV